MPIPVEHGSQHIHFNELYFNYVCTTLLNAYLENIYTSISFKRNLPRMNILVNYGMVDFMYKVTNLRLYLYNNLLMVYFLIVGQPSAVDHKEIICVIKSIFSVRNEIRFFYKIQIRPTT